jgi:signal transduction histidine kinase
MHKILVIDDENELRLTLLAALGRHRYAVIGASNCAEGLKIAKKEAPGLILCDLSVTAADGTECVDLLRKNPETSHLPLIVMSGGRSKQNDTHPILQKPFSLEQLLSTVRQHFKRPPSPAPAANTVELLQPKTAKPAAASASTARAEKASNGLPLRAEPSVEEWEQLVARIQSLREAERSGIARAIHDDLSQKLTVLAIELSLADQQLSTAARAELVKTGFEVARWSAIVNDVIRSAQEIATRLRPKVLDEFGFVAALEWLISDSKKRLGIECSLEVDGEETNLPSEVAADMFRLSQEIVATVGAPDSRIQIALKEVRKSLQMRVSVDNARGTLFRKDKTVSVDLLGMRERVENLGGSFNFETAPGERVRIAISIPLPV